MSSAGQQFMNVRNLSAAMNTMTSCSADLVGAGLVHLENALDQLKAEVPNMHVNSKALLVDVQKTANNPSDLKKQQAHSRLSMTQTSHAAI
ncbi:hypothetical protein ACMFMF_003704 [Clarireedia jacksonii]